MRELTEIYRSGHSALREPTFRVVDSPEEWEALWPLLRTGNAPTTAPEVDFESSLVLVAGWGEVATGGFLIHVDSLVTRGESRTAYVTRHRPGRCIVTLATTQPVHVVAAARAGGTIEFVDRERTYDCEIVRASSSAVPRSAPTTRYGWVLTASSLSCGDYHTSGLVVGRIRARATGRIEDDVVTLTLDVLQDGWASSEYVLRRGVDPGYDTDPPICPQ